MYWMQFAKGRFPQDLDSCSKVTVICFQKTQITAKLCSTAAFPWGKISFTRGINQGIFYQGIVGNWFSKTSVV